MKTTEFQSWIITPDKPEYWGQSAQQRTSTDPSPDTPLNQSNISKEKVEMVEIIVTNVAANFATAFFKFNVTPPSTPTTNNGSASDPSRTSFKAEELGFFDPELPIEYGSGDVVRTGKDTIYRSVHLFVQRITDMASIKGDKIVNYNLPLYLRGAALEWYSRQLTVLEKEDLRVNTKN